MLPALLSATLLLGSGDVAVMIGGELFTRYVLIDADHDPARRPFLFPVLAPGGIAVTADQMTNHGDHPHHRSVWVGLGNVNGVDHWSWGRGRRPPRQTAIERPRVAGDTLTHRLEWEDKDGGTLLREERTIRFFAYPDGTRAMDFTSRFAAIGNRVVVGDTKESGLVAVRLCAAISATPAITNAAGGRGETACWGKPAAWCDVSGTVAGKPAGVAILAHPGNPHGPARWHVRSYGLLAENPFGLAAFDPALPPGAGDLALAPGASVTFRHRVLVHLGDARAADIAAKSAAYAAEVFP